MTIKLPPTDTDIQRYALTYLGLGYYPIAAREKSKIPRDRNWQRTPDEGLTETETRAKFSNPNANIGLAPGARDLVIDSDPRNGDGWATMQALLGPLPDTPHAITGGGGEHWWFELPEGMTIPAGGSLANIGFPGLEWKAKGGQVIVEPSIHPDTNKMYAWAEGFSPLHLKKAPAPALLLEKIKEGNAFARMPSGEDEPEYRSRTDGEPGGGALPEHEVRRRFTTQYLEGDRNQTITMLTGHFKGRNICDHCAAEFLCNWQHSFFSIPLSEAEVRRTVSLLYRRDGKSNITSCKHDDEFFIHQLKQWTDPVYVASLQATAAEPRESHESREPSDPAALTKAMIEVQAQARSKVAKRAIAEWNQEDDRELATLAQGRQLGVSGTKSRFLLVDPERAMTKNQILEMQEASPNILNLNQMERMSQCGWNVAMLCRDHGNQGNSSASCKNLFHKACPSHMTYRLRQIVMPVLEEGQQYAEYWFNGVIWTEGDEWAVADAIKKAHVKWVGSVGRLNGRKATKGLVVARSVSISLGRPTSRITFKLMVKEEFAGQFADDIKKIGGETATALMAGRHFTNPEDAAIQMMLNSMSSIDEIWNPKDSDLFAGYMEAFRGGKGFQTFGFLRGAMNMIEERPKPVCKVEGCELELEPVISRPDNEEPRAAYNEPYQRPGRAPPKPW